MNFRIEPDRVPGLCGTCTNCEVRVTRSNSMLVRCLDNGQPVREQIDYCPDYRRKDIFGKSVPQWMNNEAWLGVEIQDGKSRNKTFATKDSEFITEGQSYMFDPWLHFKKGRKSGMTKQDD